MKRDGIEQDRVIEAPKRSDGEAKPLSSGPLAGVRVIDLTSVIMGPLATQILGDLGADVITIEGPRVTPTRVMTPGPHAELSGVALNLLRNKRSVALDLANSDGRAALLDLVATSDAFVTNLRPGPLRRLGLTYEDLAARRSDIVYCSAHGFPSDSERADDPAYDDIVQAATGLPDAFRRATGEPLFAPTVLADKVCGLTIVYAVIAALFHRERTGQGQRVEVPMVDAMKAFTLVEHGAGAIGQPSQDRAGYRRLLTANRKPQRTLDGWISVLPYSRQHYEDLFVEAGRPEMVGDPRIESPRTRVESADSLYADLAEIIAARTTGAWLETCARLRIPSAEVATLDRLVDELPDAEHPVVGSYKSIPHPVRFSRTPPLETRLPAPLRGEHTRQVLDEIGGNGRQEQ